MSMPHPSRPAPDDVPAAERAALRRGRLRPWLPFLLAAVLCLALLGWALVALPGLPERVPTHWGVDGRPDAWEDTSFGTVATGPLIGLGMTGFLALVSAMVTALVPMDPGLSPWRRVRQPGVHRGVQACLGWSCVLIVLVLAPTTAEVLAAGAWTMAWWLLPLTLTVLMVGIFPAMRAGTRRWTRWADRVAADLGHRPTAAELAEDEVWTPLGLKRDPEDPAVFPAKRPGYGVGVTVNLATPAGRWLVRGFVAVFIVGLPLALWLGAFAAR